MAFRLGLILKKRDSRARTQEFWRVVGIAIDWDDTARGTGLRKTKRSVIHFIVDNGDMAIISPKKSHTHYALFQ